MDKKFAGKIYARSNAVAYREIGDDVVIVDTINNRLMTLNTTGTVLWLALDGKSVTALAADLAEQFDVGEEQAFKDVVEFLTEMQTRGLVIENSGTNSK